MVEMEKNANKKSKRALLLLNVIFLAIGACGGPMVMRLYFLHGGSRLWLESWLETGGWPVTFIPLLIAYLRRRRKEGSPAKLYFMGGPVFVAAAVIGLLTGLDDYIYSYGVDRLPVSTVSLVLASHLAFTALFAFILVKQRFTPYSINAVFLLIVGAGVLALHTSGDRPEGESSKEYFLGFFMTLAAAILYGFVLPLVELTYKKAKQAITYTLVLEIQLVMCFFATLFCTIGMLINKDFKRGSGSTRGHGGPASSLGLYRLLPQRVRELVDAAGFGLFIPTLTAGGKSEHAVVTALAERWWDTSNTFHFPIGEMTVTPEDFAAITGLRVGGDPIPFDSGIHGDKDALQWLLGMEVAGSSEMVSYDQFRRRIERRVPELELLREEVTELEVEQLARVYLLYLFGATLYPNKGSKVHLSYLPALLDLRAASRFDWGGAALGACYGFMGEFSRGAQSAAGYWKVWELWAYEVLRMYPPGNRCLDLGVLPRAMRWGPLRVGKKKAGKTLSDFRMYLDHLTVSQVAWDPWRVAGRPDPEYLVRSRVVSASRVLLESAFGWQWYLGDRVARQSLGSTEFVVPGPLPPQASHTGRYTLGQLRRFTLPADAALFLRSRRDYAIYQRGHLARPLGVIEHRAVQAEALAAVAERMGRRGRPGRSGERSGYAVATGLLQLSWTLPVRDPQGEAAEVRFEPARTEPAEVTGPAPMEWVREATRLMLAMEKEFHKIASGTPLQLHYPPATPAPAAQTQGRARAALRRKTVRPIPPKGRGKAPAAVQRQASATRPEARGVVIGRASEPTQSQRETRKRVAGKQLPEGPSQKKKRLQAATEEEGTEEESTSLSSGSDSASDPGFRYTPADLAAADESDDDDDGDPEDFTD